METPIRWTIRRDIPAMLEIENLCFEFRWKEEHFRDALKRRNCIGVVAERGQRVVGFMVYELHESMFAVLNFAVHPDYQRTGVGSALCQRMFDKIDYTHSNRTKIILEVRETNLIAQKFFRKMKFICVSTLPNYFDTDDINEDAYLFEYSEHIRKYATGNRITNFFKERKENEH